MSPQFSHSIFTQPNATVSQQSLSLIRQHMQQLSHDRGYKLIPAYNCPRLWRWFQACQVFPCPDESNCSSGTCWYIDPSFYFFLRNKGLRGLWPRDPSGDFVLRALLTQKFSLLTDGQPTNYLYYTRTSPHLSRIHLGFVLRRSEVQENPAQAADQQETAFKVSRTKSSLSVLHPTSCLVSICFPSNILFLS